MSKLAYHVQHFKAGSVGAIGRHNWQKRGARDEHSNQDIDPSRSHLNMQLQIPYNGLYADAKQRIDLFCTGRVTKSSNWITETIVYPPDDVVERNDSEEIKRYFADVLSWHKQEFGFDNVLAAVVHMDETTPHMHTDLVPLTQDGRLSAKVVFSRSNLSRHHTDLAKYLQMHGWDIVRGESTIDKQVRALSVPEYKKQAEKDKLEAVKQIADVKAVLKDLERKVDALESERMQMMSDRLYLSQKIVEAERDAQNAAENAQNAIRNAEEANKRLQDILDDLDRLKTPEEVADIEAKPAMGGNVKIKKNDWKKVYDWAKQSAAAISYGDNMARENAALRSAIDELHRDIDKLKDGIADRLQLQMRLADAEASLQFYQRLEQAFEKEFAYMRTRYKEWQQQKNRGPIR